MGTLDVGESLRGAENRLGCTARPGPTLTTCTWRGNGDLPFAGCHLATTPTRATGSWCHVATVSSTNHLKCWFWELMEKANIEASRRLRGECLIVGLTRAALGAHHTGPCLGRRPSPAPDQIRTSSLSDYRPAEVCCPPTLPDGITMVHTNVHRPHSQAGFIALHLLFSLRLIRSFVNKRNKLLWQFQYGAHKWCFCSGDPGGYRV